jgi:hypothetical protein
MNRLSVPTLLDLLQVTSEFDCGKDSLSEFSELHALEKQNAKLSRPYVVLDGRKVVVYYTLAHVSVRQMSHRKKLGRGMPLAIPAILIARFAVSLLFQGLKIATVPRFLAPNFLPL